MIRRVVFDTSTVVSALVFLTGNLAWLRQHWREGGCTPIASRATELEIRRVLSYPKFRLSDDDRIELLADYLPYCEAVEPAQECPVKSRDANDQPFLDLAWSSRADVLVSSDRDLLALAGETRRALRYLAHKDLGK